jgi:hypothetical protein
MSIIVLGMTGFCRTKIINKKYKQIGIPEIFITEKANLPNLIHCKGTTFFELTKFFRIFVSHFAYIIAIKSQQNKNDQISTKMR